jgi:hypothetical protein
MNIYEKLMNIQAELKAPKGQYNSFGKYKYRSCEDILEAVKPICKKYNAVLTIKDDMEYIGERYYIKATAILGDTESESIITNTAYAREEETKKGMDSSQITGTASSYARKYALNGLFCIDDTKDADTDEYRQQEEKEDINKIIDKKMVEALNQAIEKANISDEVVELILNQYGYTSTSEIKIKDYMQICNDFKSKKKEV